MPSNIIARELKTINKTGNHFFVNSRSNNRTEVDYWGQKIAMASLRRYSKTFAANLNNVRHILH